MSDYEKVYFDKWQDLAKAVIDGGEFYIKNALGNHSKIEFDGRIFNYHLRSWVDDLYIKKQPTLAELIAIKPRLCWVWDGPGDLRIVRVIDSFKKCRYYSGPSCWWDNAQMLTDDEIKQFLNGE